MADKADISAKLEVDGEKAFRDSLKAVDAELKSLKSEMDLTASAMDDMADSEEKTAKQGETLEKIIDTQEKKLGLLNEKYQISVGRLGDLGTALENAKNEFGANSEEALKAQNAYNKQLKSAMDLKTQINQTAAEMNKAKKDFGDLGKASDDLGSSLDKAENSGKKFGVSLSGLLKGGALVAGVAALTAGVKNIVSGFKSAVDEAASLGDQIDKQSQKLQISAEDYQKLAFAAERSGTSIEQMAQAQKNLAKTDFKGDLMDAIDYVAAIADSEERAAAATELFGSKAGMELLPMLNSGTAGIKAMYDEVEALGGVMSNEAVAASAAFEDTVTNFQTSIKGLTNGLAADFLPGISSVLTGITELVKGNIDEGKQLIQGGIEGFSEKFSGLVDKLIDMSPEFLEIGMTVITQIIVGLVQNLPKLAAKAPEIVWALINGILYLGSELLNAGGVMIDEVISGAQRKLKGFYDLGINAVKGLWSGIKAEFKSIPSKFSNLLSKLVGTAEDELETHSPSKVFYEIGQYVVQGLAEGIKDGEALAANTMDALNQKIIAKEEELTEALKNSDLSEEMKESLNKQLEAVKEFRQEYESAWDEITKKQKSMAEKLADYGDLFTRVTGEAGESLIELSDLSEQINQINLFKAALDRLKAMDAPEGLIDAVANMDVDSALAYTDELFKLTKEEYDDYVKLWEEKQKLAGDHARMFYQSEFDDMKKEFIDKVPPFMDETRDEFMYDGLELMKGLAQGIQNGRSTVINTIIAVVQQAVEAAKEELGIHSPSKVFAQIGDYMAQGLSSGFTNGMKAATSDITAAMQPQMAQSTQNQGLVEGLLNGLSAMQDKAVNMAVQVVLPNGEVLAETVFNDLLNVSKQRGVSLANA